jgi:predicted membrane-bound spermidine synthase
VWLQLVTAGADGGLTVSLSDWVATGDTPFDAVNVSVYDPADPAAGVPDSVPVPLPLSEKLRPDGKVPVSDTVIDDPDG